MNILLILLLYIRKRQLQHERLCNMHNIELNISNHNKTKINPALTVQMDFIETIKTQTINIGKMFIDKTNSLFFEINKTNNIYYDNKKSINDESLQQLIFLIF